MKTIVVIKNGKLLHKKVTDEEYAKINTARDPDGKYFIRQYCSLMHNMR